MPITILPLQETEIAEAADLIVACFSEKWRAPATAEFTRLFKGDAHPTYVFVAKDAGKIVGISGCLETYFAEYTYGMCWLGVAESHRSQGIAKQLVERREAFIKTELLQGKPGTLIVATDRVETYERMGYSTHPTPMHDGTRMMAKVI